MTNNDLIEALRNERRQPVDLNLGQVPVSPTIGRMGNYNVVVPGYSTRNAATELSSALAQFPQILGQARNIQEQAGKQAANELTTDQVIERVQNGDYEAEGFLTQFGKDKAFAEQVYDRWFTSQIRPALISASSQIDNKSPEELLKMGEGDEFKAKAQAILVDSLTNNDPSILEKIADNPYTARLHNKAMEAYINEFSAKAEATAVARKLQFTKDAAMEQASNDFLSRANYSMKPYVKDETISDEANRQKAEAHRTASRLSLVENTQDAFNQGMTDAKLAGITGKDLTQVKDKLISALRSQLGLLVEQEEIDAATTLMNAMDEGTLMLDGRPFKQFKDGIDTLRYTEAMLEQYDDDLKSGNNRKDLDPNKIASWRLTHIDPISGVPIENADANPVVYENAIDQLNNVRALLRKGQYKEELSDAETVSLMEEIDNEIQGLRAGKEGRIDALNVIESSPMYRRLELQGGLSGQKFVELQTDSSDSTFLKQVGEFGITDEYESLVERYTDRATGKSVTVQDPYLHKIPETAHKEAVKEALGVKFRAFKNGELKITPEIKEEIQKDYEEAYERQYTQLIKDLAKQNGYVAGVADVTKEDLVKRMAEGEAEAIQREKSEQAGYPLKDGKITYKEERSSFADTSGFSETYVKRSVDTDNAWKMVQDAEAVTEFRNNNTEAERLEFNRKWLQTKYSESAKRERASLIQQKPESVRASARAWEVQQSRSTGLTMEILRTNRALSETYTLKNEGFFSAPTKRPFSIDYEPDLVAADAPKTRIFNVNAVAKAVRQNDFEDLIFIATEYGHAPEGSNAQSPEIQSFLNNQKAIIEKYGFMDFRKLENEQNTEEQE